MTGTTSKLIKGFEDGINKYSGSLYQHRHNRNDSNANSGSGWGTDSVGFDSDRQTPTQGLNFSQETRPKTKFFSLLIYAGYPMQ